MVTHFFDKRHLLDLKNDDVGEEQGEKDVEFEVINVATLEKNYRFWVVPQEHTLEVLGQPHDSQVAEHWGRHRTPELVSRNFMWDKWSADVAKYVAGCVMCQKWKIDTHGRQTKLVLMPTGERPFQEIVMDYVGELPESEGFNAILVVTDQFTKVQHCILAKTTWTAEDVADSYINDIWKLYCLQRHNFRSWSATCLEVP